MSEQNGVTHYVMSSAFEVDGEVKVAGTILKAERIVTHPHFEYLLSDEHIRPCDAPQRGKPEKPQIFGGGRRKKAEPS